MSQFDIQIDIFFQLFENNTGSSVKMSLDIAQGRKLAFFLSSATQLLNMKYSHGIGSRKYHCKCKVVAF